MKKNKEKIKEKLEKYLNRKPTEDEIINAEKDQNIINEILLDEINNINEEIIKLKKKK